MAAENFRSRIMGLKKNPKAPLPFQGSLLYFLAIFLGYMVADLSLMYFRPAMLPSSSPPAKPPRGVHQKLLSRSEYGVISRRNIFNADGTIPPPLASEGKGGEGGWDGPPVLSQLPLKLVGTIVHMNPNKSVATLLLTSRNDTKSFVKGEQIEGVAEVTKVDRRKVFFKNLNTRRLEYVEIPEDMTISFGPKIPAFKEGEEVQKRGDNEFAVNRADFEKYTADLSKVLTQARMMPNNLPNGEVQGFKFVSIEPNSIYEKLGFKVGDIIKEVNGEPVNSPTKGLELYRQLKDGNGVKLTINRGGHDESVNFNIE